MVKKKGDFILKFILGVCLTFQFLSGLVLYAYIDGHTDIFDIYDDSIFAGTINGNSNFAIFMLFVSLFVYIFYLIISYVLDRLLVLIKIRGN